MTISSRDKRALIALAAAAVVFLAITFWPGGSGAAPEVVAATENAAAVEQRLTQTRRLAALVPAREEQLKVLAAELETWEQTLIRTETAQQAQAEVLKILRRIGNAQTPPLEFRSEEIGQVRPVGKDKNYGEVLVAVSFTCAIEQLVNLLADLTAQPEAVGTEDLRVNAGNPKDKLLNVRLTVAGMVPHQLVPERKGLTSF
ncbi:MAG: hypothetical protein KIT09_25435 [Bryobacteraceae bacterium]|nr:hypothetical protein [Bryobacteraceae bacterium]